MTSALPPASTAAFTPRKPDPKKDTILVVGDWVIDEYWFLARHQSDTSSFAGFQHFRISAKPNDVFSDLCGAGHTTKIISKRQFDALPKKKKKDLSDNPTNRANFPLLRVHGVGLWNSDLTRHMTDLLHENGRGNNYCNYNFGGAFEFRDNMQWVTIETLVPAAHTIKTVRSYQHSKGELEQLSRVDWDKDDHKSETCRAALKRALNGNAININKENVKAIVIHDMTKGCITDDVINALHRRFDEAEWYVRTKDGTQPWLSELDKKGLLALNVAGPERTSIDGPWNRWIINKLPTRDAMNYVEMLPGTFAVAISREHEIVIKSCLNDEPRCIVSKSSSSEQLLTQLGWSSRVFAELAYELIAGADKLKADESALKDALKSIVTRADEDPRVIEPTPKDKPEFEDRYAEAYDWETTNDEWVKSLSDRGIIRPPQPTPPSQPVGKIELWRATSTLPGYVAIVEGKRKLIRDIGQRLGAFAATPQPSSPLSILLTADPGAGKSMLVRSLAKALNFEVLPSNITQMLHRDDLLHLFDDIAARQANDAKPLLVFVDEINAVLDSEPVFSAFLAPLEDGAYVRQGRKVTLRPCVWFFVGTAEKEGEAYGRSDKHSDFLSRITMNETMTYDHLQMKMGTSALDHEARLEQVYLGMSLLRNNHPDLLFVEHQILDAFYSLTPKDNPARRIRTMAASVRGVQERTVRAANCKLWSLSNWSKDGQLIEVKS